jgi:hypothetical protein
MHIKFNSTVSTTIGWNCCFHSTASAAHHFSVVTAIHAKWKPEQRPEEAK